MAEPELQIIRGYELRLLRCAQPPTPANSSATQSPPSDQIPTHHLHLLITDLLNSIETGDYLRALFSDSARLVFKLADNWPESLVDSADCAERVYSELIKRAESFMVEDCEDEKDKACRVIVVMCLAVAAFLWFTQCNMTGPLEGLAKRPVPFNVSEGEELVEWDSWARNQLTSAGSDLLGKLSKLQYIVFSKMLLLRAKDFLFEEESLSSTYGIRSISWWLARLLLFQQRILDERSSALFDILHVFMGETVHHFGSLENVTCYWDANLPREEASTIVSMVHLEAGIMEYSYGRVDSCRLHLESAEVDAGLQLSLTGILGFRTVHQVEPKAQLVLVANTATSNSGDSCSTLAPQIQTNDSSINQNNSDPHQCETSESSDILVTPKLIETDNKYGSGEGIQNGHRTVASLKAIQQALILAKCLLIEKSGRHDEMQGWEMAPYIEAIDSQPSSYFIIRCFCDILRIRWESTRSRTKQRALLMMEKLVQCVDEPSLDVAQRIFLSFGVYMPTVTALRKEYGELLVSCGLIGEALKIFEDLELWDHLIHCYCLLKKKAAAVELIKTQLSKMPTDPRLWCSLGDVTSNDSCYEKALEVSNNRSARAKRSLARSAYNRGDYEQSKILWESAMALNSLYPDGWYALGAAALKARDVEKALDAFTRAVQLNPENGEAWNNIACLHMMKKKSKEAFIAFKEALKFKRNSWQLWENYSQVALEVGSINQALEAMQKVLDMTSNKRIDAELLERIMLEMEGRASTSLSMLSPLSNKVNTDVQIHPDDCSMDSVYKTSTEFGAGKSQQETEHLLELLGKILQQIVRSGSGADTWGIYARWLKIKGDLTMSSEALLKQVRSYQGSDLWKDEERFKKFAHASLELCKVYMEISSSTGSRRELLAAEMHLRNIIKQGGSFSATEEFRNLQACHDEVKVKLQSDAVPT